MTIEYAERFAVRRKPNRAFIQYARLIEFERRLRIDELREHIKRLDGPAYFDTRMKLRGEILDLHAQCR